MLGTGRTAVAASERRTFRCAIYTRKSSEHGLEQDFNSLDAQREAAEAYIKSQAHEGWKPPLLRLRNSLKTTPAHWYWPSEKSKSPFWAYIVAPTLMDF